MAVLDRYLETLRTPGAQMLTFTANAPIDLLVNGSRRTVSKGTATADQINAILREVVPAEVLMKAESTPQEFQYVSPIGPVRIAIRLIGNDIMARVSTWAEPTASSPPTAAAPTAKVPSAQSGPAPATYQPGSQQPATYQPGSQQPATSKPVASRPTTPAASNQQGTAATRRPVGAKCKHLDELFHQMLNLKASDLHLKSEREPFVRIHGEMEILPGHAPFSSAELWDLLLPIMPERNREQFQETRDTDFAYELPNGTRMRSNVFKDILGVGAVFRQIPSKILSAKDLGLPEAVLRLCEYPKGLVLVTGPTGSGKSTTLAAMIDYINATRRDHIITIEDPVEFVHPDKSCLINQREIGASTASFRSALRAALREDPDIVLVGELRDLETTAIAIETAETGHLVFATLHTNTATSTIDRVINQFPADRQAQIRAMMAESLVGVVSQTLCKKKGGGRVAALEVLIVTPAVSNLIREEKIFQLASVIQTSRGIGMQTMNDALLNLVKAGSIEPEEAYSCSVVEEMAMALTRSGFHGAWSQV